jgi:hypothetical protein
MAEPREAWKLHFAIEDRVPAPPERIGYAQLQRAVEVGQRGRVKRAVSTLVALDVLQWQGAQQGRAVTQGPRSLHEALEAGIQPMPEREIQTYPLLAGALDDYLTRWHRDRQDPIDDSGGATAVGDGVTTYGTSSLSAAHRDRSTAHTRPDLTVVVDLEYPHLGSWNEVHAVEVKPYWSVTRAALFEAAAQAALRRCTFSWLLAWIPDPNSGHFTRPQAELIRAAERVLSDLTSEAASLGLGLLVARDLGDAAELEAHAEPTRQAMEPRAADELFRSLGRSDSAATT